MRRVAITVPWHRLSSEPVVVEIDTVELLAATNYDLGHEALGELEQRIRGAIEAKLQRVKEAETARQERKFTSNLVLACRDFQGFFLREIGLCFQATFWTTRTWRSSGRGSSRTCASS